MLIKAKIKYKDRDSGKIYDINDLRDVPPDRGQELIAKGWAESYKPEKEDDKQTPSGKGAGDKSKQTPNTPDASKGANGNWETPAKLAPKNGGGKK